MKILNAIHNQSIGGVDQMFRYYTIALQKAGCEVALLVSDNNNCNYSETKTIFKLKNKSQIFDFFHLLWVLFKYRPNLVFCHSNRVMKWMKIATKITFVKSVAINHGISFKNSLNCDYIININSQINQMVVDSGFNPQKSFVVENVILLDKKYQEKNLKSSLVIGMYGRIEERKGFDILIKACEILAKNNIDFILKIGGFEVCDGYNLQTIKNLTKDCGIYEKCNFVGVVINKKEFFQDVDIFVVPSREEPFGLVILEGFANSTLVISSDTIGGKMLIENEKNGLIFANKDSQDLAQKIIFAIENKEKYCTYTRNAYNKLVDEFNIEIFVKKIKNFLSQIK